MAIRIEDFGGDQILIDPEMFARQDASDERSIYVLDHAAISPGLLSGWNLEETVSLNELIASSFGRDTPTRGDLEEPVDLDEHGASQVLANFDPLLATSVIVILDDDPGHAATFGTII